MLIRTFELKPDLKPKMFCYNQDTTLKQLHDYIRTLLQTNDFYLRYQPHDLNTTKRFHLRLCEWNLNNQRIKVISRSNMRKGGSPKVKKKRGRKRKFSDLERIENHQRAVRKCAKKNPVAHRKSTLNAAKRYAKKNPNVNRLSSLKYARRKRSSQKTSKIIQLKKIIKKYKFKQCDRDTFEFNEDLFSPHDSGRMNHECKHCGAVMFMGEKLATSKKSDPEFSLCCDNGKIRVPFPEIPDFIVNYLTDNTPKARYFRKNIRSLNAAFAFTSTGGNKVQFKGAPGSYTVEGQMYHIIGTHFGPNADVSESYIPQFASIYFFDVENELKNRTHFGFMKDKDSAVAQEVIKDLQEFLHERHRFYKEFKTQIQRSIEEDIPELKIIIKADLVPDGKHKGMTCTLHSL